MSVEDVPSPSTYRDHLLSRSLFRELFRHNLVGADGRIKDDLADLNRYRSTLKRMYAERTAVLYKRRNKLVSEAENILKIISPLPSDERRLKEILDELDLESNGGEISAPKEPLKVPRRYLGSSEPKLSICERKLLEEIQRSKVLKRDLKILDKWLKEITTPVSKIVQIRRIPSLTWKNFQKKHYARVKKRGSEMDQARRNLVHAFSSFNENVIRKLVAAGDSVEKQRIYRSSRQLPDDAKVSNAVKSETATCVSISSTTTEDEDKSISVYPRVRRAIKSHTATYESASSTSPEDEDKSRSIDAKILKEIKSLIATRESESSKTSKDEDKRKPDDAKIQKAVKSHRETCESASSKTPKDEDKSRYVYSRVQRAIKSHTATYEPASSTSPEDKDKSRSVDAKILKDIKSLIANCESASSKTSKDEDKRKPADAKIQKTVKSHGATCESASSKKPEDEDKSRSVYPRVRRAIKSHTATYESESSTSPEDEDKSRSIDAKILKDIKSHIATCESTSSETPEDEDKSSKSRWESLTSIPVLQSQENTEDTGTSEEI